VKPYEAVGYQMLQTSAITAITSTRIYHGLRPQGTVVPAITYYELPGTRFSGIESQGFSINCRARTAGGARDLARKVIDLFAGSDGTGTYGAVSSFSVMRASLRQDQGLVPEPEDGLFNAPVDIQIVYPVDDAT
jgi:hypothetical protein